MQSIMIMALFFISFHIRQLDYLASIENNPKIYHSAEINLFIIFETPIAMYDLKNF